VKEYAATLKDWTLSLVAANVGASALTIAATMKVPTIAITNVNTAAVSPATTGARYVPTNGTEVPTNELPMKPARALTPASGTI
jgi:hypothetical protein